MSRNYRHTSFASMLVVAILMCSIVCSVTSVFGRGIPAQGARVFRKDATTAQFTTQLAEKVESESNNKHCTPLFVIHTVIQLFRFDLAMPGYSGLVYATRFGVHRNIIPIYLVERVIRI